MNRILICSVCLAITSSANAVDVYKCKGTHGEIIYQNDPCPHGDKALATGQYQRQPDDSTNQAQAAAYQQQQHEQYLSETARNAAEQREMATRGSTLFDTVDAANQDPRSVAGIAARNTALNAGTIREGRSPIGRYATPIGAYSTPIGGAPQRAAVGSSGGKTYEDFMHDTAKQTTQQHDEHASMNDCRLDGGGSGSITCYDSSGHASYGHADSTGNVRLSNGEELHHDATGKLRGDDGTCVKDIYGQCQ